MQEMFRQRFQILASAVSLACLSLNLVAQQPRPATDSQTPKATAAPLTAKQNIAQGVELYRQSKFDQASKKFLAALKLEPNNDEALGYGSLTAYQLGNQSVARDLFQKRADLPNQKSTVRIFCMYMVALTQWRDARELIAKHGEITGGKTTYAVPEKDLTTARDLIAGGLAGISRVLQSKPDYAEAFNVRNLLHAEAAAIEPDERKWKAARAASLSSLHSAMKLSKGGAEDFGSPTFRVGEFGATDDEQAQLIDPELKEIEGGRPVTREVAYLPVITIGPVKSKSDGSGLAPGGGAVSVGPGQGALRSSRSEVLPLKAGKAKVEVLVSSTGKVVFARILDGPGPTTAVAIAAAKKWTFSPPRFEGQPIQVIGVITFDVQPPPVKPGAKQPAPTPGEKAKTKPKPGN